ncbi:imidazolonepropionase [Nocardioides luteus]|uniref:Imidazolonepropionase n=1 Tax=Nocardioides luteus TaxID=1844 RepID=A0ABQ5ST90_9ACTN|nr:imidazolonepropionase [Nocardioides luteus]MDR7309734.1 imidazolonepropionase [Nocardioides luteus]GGR61694.1 imidazolonepropionase [Nocardioides luteus]GLJ67357.1 imidazolonepropionase [Nocardioides luteus]
MSLLLTDIGELTTHTDEHGTLNDAAIVIEDGRVAWIGPADRAPAADDREALEGRAVLPGWVDSHTHLASMGDRAEEFVDRMAGRPYQAGGIVRTVEATRAADDHDLSTRTRALREEAFRGGTTTIEAKTGYGLDVETEQRLARVSAEHADIVTYLGAHVVPADADRRDYIDLVTGAMLDAVAPHATFIDVFCETGAFDVEESREILLAGQRAGLGLKVHGNQLGESGGVRLAVELGATSVDHCNHLSPQDIDALAGSTTVATILPACDLSTREPFAPARELVDAGATIAIASNCNPGSSFTTSMAFCVATAVLQQRLTFEEALWAATVGGATALGLDDSAGRITEGGPADLHALDAPSAKHLAYRPGVPLTHKVWKRGASTSPAQ